MGNPVHKFYLKVGSDNYVQVFPRWDGTTKQQADQGQNEMYFRTKHDGTFIFQREDYRRINDVPFSTEFRLKIEEKQSDGTFSILYPLLRFSKAQCKFDQDGRTVEVSPDSFDTYDSILGGIDKEFNLIDLAPPTTPITYRKQAVLQVALPGAPYIANFTDGIFWELPVASPLIGATEDGERDNHNLMLDTYGFGVYNPGTYDYVRAIVVGEGLTVDVSGIYDAFNYLADGFDAGTYRRLDDAYKVQKVNLGGGNYRLEVQDDGTGTTLYVSNTYATPEIFIAPLHDGFELSYVSDPAEKIKLYIFRPYVRLLTDETTVSGIPTVELPDNDPFPSGSFTRALPIETANFTISDETQAAATRWGKVIEGEPYGAGEYFTRPAITGATLMPVIGSDWAGVSYWFYLDSDLRETQQAAGETITVNDAYKLADVIKVLVEEITGGAASHLESTNFSQFLYGTGDIRGAVEKFPVIVPKSNILIGDYDQPAQKALIKLSDVILLLRFFHNAFWHLSESIFKVEHYEYYHRGQSYGADNVGADLTKLLEPKTGLPWAKKANQYEYKFAEIPERIEFGWMDKGSLPFDGYPINCLSIYAQKGNIQQNRIGRFTSDIDFVNVSPSDVTKDGFVFFECISDGAGGLVVPFVNVVISDQEDYKLQNGYASFVWGHPQYHVYGLPTEQATINQSQTTAESVRRAKVQEIELALSDTLNPYELVTTNLGAGRIEKMEKTLSAGTVKLTIKHDNE